MERMTVIETEDEIKGIHHSKNTGEYAFMIISGNFWFSVYYVYEELMIKCEFDHDWHFNYRFAKDVKQYGQNVCFEFN